MLTAPIPKKKSVGTPTLIVPAIALSRPEKKVLTKGQYVEYKCFSSPGDTDSPAYNIQIPYFGSGTPEEWLMFLDNLDKALVGQHITDGPGRYEFTERLLQEDTLATFRLKTLEVGTRTVDHFNEVMARLTEHIFPVHAYREQKRFLRRFLKKPKDWTAREFVTRVQEINSYLVFFRTETQEAAASLPEDELVEALYHAMPNFWRNTMVLQGFNYANHTCIELLQFCERLETLEPPAEKKKKSNDSKPTTSSGNKRKHVSLFNLLDDEGNRKHCLLHGYCAHTTNECDDLKPMVSELKKKKAAAKTKRPRSVRMTGSYTSSSGKKKNYVHKDEVNSLVEKKMKKFLKKKKEKKNEVHQMEQFANTNLSENEDEKFVSSDSSSDSDSS